MYTPPRTALLASVLLTGCAVAVAEPSPAEKEPPPSTNVPVTPPPSGALAWSRVYGGGFDDSAASLARAPGRHVRFTGHGPLDGATDPAETRGLLMDVDEGGGLAAHHRFGVSSYAPVTLGAAAIGASGDTIVLGSFDGKNDIGGCSLVGGPGGGELLAAVDGEGSCLWATTFIDIWFSSLDVGPGGQIVFAGIGAAGASLGGGISLPKPAAGSARFFAMASSQGELLGAWDAAIGVDEIAQPIVRFDGEGVVVALGSSLTRYDVSGAEAWSRSTAEVGRIGALAVAGGRVIVAAGADAKARILAFRSDDGGDAWQIGLTSNDALGAISFGVSETSDLALVARFTGAASLGDIALGGGPRDNLVWAVLDGEGGVSRHRVVAFDGTADCRDIATSADGDVWILGQFTGSVDFGDGLHVAHAPPPPTGSPLDPMGYDVFLARYR